LEVDVQQGNFKILQLFLQVLILFLAEKWNPPTRSETTKIGKKNRRILGVKKNLKLSADDLSIHFFGRNKIK
jgi:hypothetical protein